MSSFIRIPAFGAARIRGITHITGTQVTSCKRQHLRSFLIWVGPDLLLSKFSVNCAFCSWCCRKLEWPNGSLSTLNSGYPWISIFISFPCMVIPTSRKNAFETTQDWQSLWVFMVIWQQLQDVLPPVFASGLPWYTTSRSIRLVDSVALETVTS